MPNLLFAIDSLKFLLFAIVIKFPVAKLDDHMTPEVQVAYVGSSVTISCPYQNPHWKLNWYTLRRDIRVESYKIKIKRVTEHHDGVYSCTNRQTGQTVTSMLRVGYRDSSRVTPRLRKQEEGSMARFICSSYSAIQWYMNTGMVHSGVQILGRNLVIQIQVSADVGGKYYCYGYDKATRKYFLSEGILVPIDQSKILPVVTQLVKKKKITIMCDTIAPSIIKWYFNNGPLPENAASLEKDMHYLEIKNPKESNFGFYECIGIMNTSRGANIYFSAISVVVKKTSHLTDDKKGKELLSKLNFKHEEDKLTKWNWLFPESVQNPKSIIDTPPESLTSFSQPIAKGLSHDSAMKLKAKVQLHLF